MTNTPTPTEAIVTELLPCPRCGSGASLYDDDGLFYIACNNLECLICFGENYDPCGNPDHAFLSEAEAIRLWNTRTTHAEATSVEVERVGKYGTAVTQKARTIGLNSPEELMRLIKGGARFKTIVFHDDTAALRTAAPDTDEGTRHG